MRPKQKRVLSAILLTGFFVGTVGFLYSSLTTKDKGTLGVTLEQLEQSKIQYYTNVSGTDVKLIDFGSKNTVASFQSSVNLTEPLSIPYYQSNIEFYQVFKTDTSKLAIIIIKDLQMSINTLSIDSKILDITLDNLGVHILTEGNIERFNYQGELIEKTPLNKRYSKVLRHNQVDVLFEGEYAYYQDAKYYLAGNVISVAKDESHLYVLNDFGKGNGNNMLIKIKADDLYIENIASVHPNGSIVGLSKDSIYIETNEGLSVISKSSLEEDFISPSPLKDLNN